MNQNRSPWLPLCALSFVLFAYPGCVVIPIGDLLKQRPLKELVLEEGEGILSRDKIAVIQVEGAIASRQSGGLLSFQSNTVNEIHQRLQRVRNDSEVKALILRISSPGGEVTACDVIHREILDLKEEREIPVIASIIDMGASGGYYIAAAADEIHARPTAVVGSIGVLIQSFNIAGLFDKIGVEATTIKSAAFKDLVSPYRPVDSKERAVLKSVVDAMHSRFVEVVDNGRPGLDSNTVQDLADGKVYIADEARELGLVDAIGDLDDVITRAAELARIDDPTVVTYRRAGGSSSAYTIEGADHQLARPADDDGGLSFTVKLDSILPRTRFLYLWAP